MALAILSAEPGEAGKRWFRFDLGANRYYRLAIGDEVRRTKHGVPLLAEPSWISDLQGPLAEESLGRGRVGIDDARFDRDHRYVQLISYRSRDGQGPAASDIVASQPVLPDATPSVPGYAVASSWRGTALGHTSDKVEPNLWVRAPRADAMFLEGLIGMLPGVVGHLAPLLPSLGKIVEQAGPLLTRLVGGSKVGGEEVGAALKSPETVAALEGLLKGLAEVIAGGAKAKSLSKGRNRAAMVAALQAGPRRSMAMNPAIAALPMLANLAPVLQQILSPETLKAILPSLEKMLPAVFNGIKDLGNVGKEIQKQELDHIERMVPSVDDPALDKLVGGLGRALSAPDPGLRWRRVEGVKLSLLDVRPALVGGDTLALYAHGHDVTFPLSVARPSTRNGGKPVLRDATLQLQVKDADTLVVVAQKHWPIGDVENDGLLPGTFRVTAEELSALEPARRYLFCLTLTWRARDGGVRGAPLHHMARIARSPVFDRVEEAGQPIALEDMERFRDYWHRLWGGRFRDDGKAFELDARYFYALGVPDRAAHARLETQVAVKPKNGSLHTREGRLKSGMELALAAMNRLAPLLAPDARELDAEHLRALATGEFAERYHRAVRTTLRFRGRSGESFAVWAYPAVALQTVVLKRVASVDGLGQVASWDEERVRFPMPVQIHFVGMSEP